MKKEKKPLTKEEKTILLLKQFGIIPNDSNIQMFQELFNVKETLQLTVLPQKSDVEHVLCLMAVDEMTRPVFYDETGELISNIPSLPKLLYDKTIFGMRSYKGTFPAIFQRIFEQNPPQEMVMPNHLPQAIPEEKKPRFTDRFRRQNNE